MPVRYVPHILTSFACCCGLASVLLAVEGRYQAAVLFVLIAAIFDNLDGKAARYLNSSSRFGVEFDSLSDVISFGIAPGLILYHWLFNSVEGALGWVVVFVLGVCAALRLARFNCEKNAEECRPAGTNRTGADNARDTTQDNAGDDAAPGLPCFIGLATPSAALLALLPMVISFGIWPELTNQPWIAPAVALWVSALGLLMVSRVPTFALKGMNINGWQTPALGLVVLAGLVFFILTPWKTLAWMSIAYAASIPLACIYQHRLGRKDLEQDQQDITS